MPKTSSPLVCGTCRLCCVGQDVFLLPVKGDDVASYRTVRAVNPMGLPSQRLTRKANGECTYLAETGCSIYERRPFSCRVFDCRETYYQPAAERRARAALGGPQDRAIIARGRELVENEKK